MTTTSRTHCAQPVKNGYTKYFKVCCLQKGNGVKRIEEPHYVYNCKQY